MLDLLRGLVRDMGLSAIIVTHDLAVVRLLADRLMVMKSGQVVEQGLTDQVLDDPQHAYTQLLVSSVLAGVTSALLQSKAQLMITISDLQNPSPCIIRGRR